MPKDNPLYIKYHDEEWGVPVHNDKKHFEFLILEGAQAGLSWLTILKRREGYRKAFANFAPKKVAKFTEEDFVRLLNDPGIIRNKLKIRAAINNAQKFLEIQKEFGSFDKYIWSFVASPPPYRRGKGGGQQVPSLEPALAADRGGLGRVMPINHHLRTLADYPVTTPESDALSKDLKKRGFKFVGSTIIYAHMQACGLVNDHSVDCFRHTQ